MKNINRRQWIVALAVVLASASTVFGATRPPSGNILLTPHNLSISGGGGEHDIRSGRESRVCIFCHAPHHATAVTPLWSREIATLTTYTPYTSPTLKGDPQQPRGPSRLCLSCHDGTIALGLLAGGVNLDPALPTMPFDADPHRNPNLGTDLSDDHPVSLPYLYGANAELSDPGGWPAGVRLDDGSTVECTSCHDPHDNRYGKFLTLDSSEHNDALCTVCHAKAGWADPDTVHRTGGTRYPAVSAAIARQGCRNCHLPHSAPGVPHLLKAAPEENNCLSACHREAPYADIWSQFSATPYNHPVALYQGVHGANEATGTEDVPVPASRKHVECVDCHNPHRAGVQGVPLGSSTPILPPPSVPPAVSGALRGVRGVEKNGVAAVAEARFEYEICFKCHAGSAADQFTGSAVRPQRHYEAFDLSQRFGLTNPSFHPVVEERTGTGRSLRAEYQATMVQIYCTDCHVPHGANEPFLLRAANETNFPAGLVSDYPLCFRCHDRDLLLDPFSSPQPRIATLHRKHVLGDHDNGNTDRAPCSACHDPHGAPATRGATPVNGAHLINFDTRFAGPAPAYDALAGSCTVACHTVNPRTF